MDTINNPSDNVGQNLLKKFFDNYPFISWTSTGFVIALIPSLRWVFVIFLIIGIYRSIQLRKRKIIEQNNEIKESIIKETQNFIEHTKLMKSLTPISSSLVLGMKENAFLEEKTILRETRSVRQFHGTGIRVRVMKGVSVGQSKGRAESHREWRDLDVGNLILTNKKIVFDGGREDRSIPLNKILTITPTLTTIEVSSSSRVGSMIFPVKNPFIWATAIRILSAVEDPLNLGELNLDVQFK